ncbi:MAG: hypothetical protein JXB88_21760 [Spirochaetales bacterium]|nr:hypothetical protein [Spirochaetales bacterium]
MVMNAHSVFDRLVLDLSSRERFDLLEKIRSQKGVSEEPLLEEKEESEEAIDFEAEYKKFNIFKRFIIFIVSLFTGRNKNILVEGHLLKKLGSRIMFKYPGLINFSKNQLLRGMLAELESLNLHISPLKNSFQATLGVERSDFFAFFVSLELEEIQQRIIEETEPYVIFESGQFTEIAEIRGEMEKRFNKIIEDISREDRQKIYQGVFTLTRFYQLCSFDFDEMLSLFSKNQFGGSGILSFSIARNKIMRLCDLIQSVHYPPPSNALKAVFLFSNYEKIGDPYLNLGAQLDRFLKEADITFSAIRRFNKKVPLPDIIKCMSRNYNYKPEILKGGEDWFVLFKNFWDKQFDKIFKSFYKEKKIKVFVSESLAFLNMEFFRKLEYYMPEIAYNPYSLKHYLSLLFIKNFYEKIFLPRLNKALNALFINGNFYKKENRTSYTDAYNGMTTVYDKIHALDKSVSPEGELGIEIEAAKNEGIKTQPVKRKAHQIFKEINIRTKLIVEEAISHYTMLINILDGILYGQVGGKFDSISNMRSIGGKENHETVSSWRNSLNKLNKALELLKDIYQLEERSS